MEIQSRDGKSCLCLESQYCSDVDAIPLCTHPILSHPIVANERLKGRRGKDAQGEQATEPILNAS